MTMALGTRERGRQRPYDYRTRAMTPLAQQTRMQATMRTCRLRVEATSDRIDTTLARLATTLDTLDTTLHTSTPYWRGSADEDGDLGESDRQW